MNFPSQTTFLEEKSKRFRLYVAFRSLQLPLFRTMAKRYYIGNLSLNRDETSSSTEQSIYLLIVCSKQKDIADNLPTIPRYNRPKRINNKPRLSRFNGIVKGTAKGWGKIIRLS